MRKWLRRVSLSLLCAAAIECATAGVASAQVEIEPDDASASKFKIVVTGRIDVTTLMEFSRAIIDPRIAYSLSASVELDSRGGSVFAAMAIGVLVRKGGFETRVGRRHTCDSACVLVLAAGVERSAAPGSVNIHRPYVVADQPQVPVRARYDEAVASIRNYLRDMGMRDHLLDAMLAVPSNRLKALSYAEMQAFGLATAASAGMEMPDAPPAPSMVGRSNRAAVRKHGTAVRADPRPSPQQRLLRAIVAGGPPAGFWSAPGYDSRYRVPSGRTAARSRRAAEGVRHGSRKLPSAARADAAPGA